MPHQQYIADVSLEVDDRTGLLVYRNVTMTLPRQSGKTLLLLVILLVRCMVREWRRQTVVYTAQSHKDARHKWEHGFLPTLSDSEFIEGHHYRKRVANGTEFLAFPETGSMQYLPALGDSGGHGDSLDQPMIDEAFSLKNSKADAAFVPALVTRPNSQYWVNSTRGYWWSSFLNGKLDKGEAAAFDGRTEGTAFFDWSAPADAELFDTKAWPLWMPALGDPGQGYTQTVKSILAAIDAIEDEDEARRAFMNHTIAQTAGERDGMNMDAWSSQTDPGSKLDGRAVLAVDTSPDRTWTSLAVSGGREGGGYLLEVIDRRVGTTWVPARAAKIKADMPDIVGVALEKNSPAWALAPDLEEWGLSVIPMSSADHAEAAGRLFDGIVGDPDSPPDVWHLGQPVLDTAAAEAAKRPRGEAWAWRRDAEEVTALIAATLAFGAFRDLPAPAKRSVYEDRGIQTV